VNKPHEGLRADGLKLGALVADDLRPALVDAHLAGLRIPFPAANGDAIDHHLQPARLLLGVCQPLAQLLHVILHGSAHRRTTPQTSWRARCASG